MRMAPTNVRCVHRSNLCLLELSSNPLFSTCHSTVKVMSHKGDVSLFSTFIRVPVSSPYTIFVGPSSLKTYKQ